MEPRLYNPAVIIGNLGLSAWCCVVAVLLCVPSMYLLLQGRYSILVFGMFSAALLLAWRFNRSVAILAAFLYLLFLGDIRRIVNSIIGAPLLDPLVLLGSLFAAYLVAPLIFRLKLTDSLAKPMLVTTIIMIFAVFNPAQGNIKTGFSGALFFITPVLWFWIARVYSSERLIFLLLYRVTVPVGVLAAMLGICQTYVGFLPWEESWIKAAVHSGYTALYIGSHIRAFGFSPSSAEYGNLLKIATVCVVTAAFAGRRAYLLLLPLLVVAQVLASQRGTILSGIVGIVAVWAIRSQDIRAWLPRIIIGLPLTGCLLYFAASRSSDSSASVTSKGTAASAATSHVTQGLVHPFDSRYSTVGLHGHLFYIGVMHGFTHPLGDGLGAVTLGADKFGGIPSVPGSTEVDVSDLFVTTGFLGGFAFIFTVIRGLAKAVSYTRRGPPILSYSIVGILVSMLGVWIPQGQYSAGPIVWFCLGFLAVQNTDIPRIEDAAPSGVYSVPNYAHRMLTNSRLEA